MQRITTIEGLKKAVAAYKKDAKTIGFVPTMGNLHVGHLSLIQKARTQCDVVITSIFVNPLQFGEHEDFGKYPRTTAADLEQLKKNQCDVVFLPEQSALLSPDTSYVEVPKIGESLEDDHRLGHLRGVATIVTKLFNLVRPSSAYFGKKDYQQWLMVKKMVADLNMDINVVGCETVREHDGLALSSRNQYLNEEQRKIAPSLRKVLLQCADAIRQKANVPQTLQHAINELNAIGFSVDYFELRQQNTLKPTTHHKNVVLVSTARLGDTRLLDNIEI